VIPLTYKLHKSSPLTSGAEANHYFGARIAVFLKVSNYPLAKYFSTSPNIILSILFPK